MKLTNPTELQLKTLMSWFSNQQETYQWGGPEFPFPFDTDSFREGLKLDELNSFALIDDNDQFVAFGQFYLRIGRCHLGRLVVNPSHRGRGVGKVLVQHLIEKGRKNLNVSECSLFVLNTNQSAKQLYQSAGFIKTDYPQPMPLANCDYMVKSDF
ncbi:GNAT family N-acetyltransferase [Neptunicella sp.]|uniref:GNAT family N-acetyltransferase n=1 Tax=Neptunicella sp. TaxID=2125986 RepID=UPI003F68C00E